MKDLAINLGVVAGRLSKSVTGVQTLGRDLGPVTGVPRQERTCDQLKYYGMEMGYTPPPGVDRQTLVKTVPSPSYYVRGR